MTRFAAFAAFAALLCSCAPSARAPAPARLEALNQSAAGEFCTDDGAWCVVAAANGPIEVRRAAGGEAQLAATIAPSDAMSEHGVWPSIIRQGDRGGAETVIVGVTQTQNQMYSGGGGEATHVALYRLTSESNGASNAAPVFVAPLSGEISIRACFSPEDETARRGACLDEYSFSGTLAVDDASRAAPANLILTTEASTYPGRRSRTEDSRAAPPLGQSDLVRARDETCSYRRVLTFNAGSGVYEPDQPLPACPDYLEP